MALRRLALGLLPFVLPGLGCDSQTCTAADCESRAALGISTDDELLLPEGTLQFLVELDGEEWSIECPADADACGSPEGPEAPVRISARRGIGGATVEFVSTNDPDAMPTDFRFQVFLADAQIVDESGSFDYSIVEPNGPECGPTCRNAETEVFMVAGVSG